MRTILTAIVLVATITACGGDEAATTCDELWVEGADVTDLEDGPCDVDGQPTYFGYASFDCTDGEQLRLNDYGHWRSDEMILRTEWSSASDYTLAQVEAICPQA